MKAPDKIYVHVRTEPRPSITFSEAQEENSSNVEYISKDALLGWAKTKLSHLQEDFDVYTGQRLILRELIEKINAI